MGSGNLAECQRGQKVASPWLLRLHREIEHSRTPIFFNLKKEGPGMAPLSLGGFFGGEMRVPGHANLAECQRGSKSGAPLAKGYLGGIPPGIFEKYFLLARRDPAKSIVETVLSRKPFFKNLEFSKMWDPEIWQSAREGKKWRPVYYYTPPPCPP